MGHPVVRIEEDWRSCTGNPSHMRRNSKGPADGSHGPERVQRLSELAENPGLPTQGMKIENPERLEPGGFSSILRDVMNLTRWVRINLRRKSGHLIKLS
jgi:hypothetical protein